MSEQQLLTVGDLLGMPTLGQRLLAGSQGLDRPVLWAHSCELPDPWRWLGPGELLMTVGLCVPEDAETQVEFIRRLADASLAGVTIGDDDPAPALSHEMLTEADRLGFPLLRTSLAVPFVSLGRTVALAGSTRQVQQLQLLSRLYRVLTGLETTSTEALERIESVFGARLAVVDVVHHGAVLEGSLKVATEVVVDLCARAAEAKLPVGASLTASSSVKAWPLPTQRPTLLMLEEGPVDLLDAFLVGHLRQAVTASVNGVLADAAARAARAEQLFSAVLVGDVAVEVVRDEAVYLGLEGSKLVSFAATTTRADDAVAALGAKGLRFLPRRTQGRLVCCVREVDLDAALSTVRSTVDRVGISLAFGSLQQLRQAQRNALWALSTTSGGTPIASYADVRGSIVPRDVGVATELSNAVLGALLDDNDRSSRLLETLSAYLDNNRSWKDTAEALGIHRQTLAHRLGRIEELTGRNLKSSADIAALWVAVRAVQHARDVEA
ncbi:PucR family transcriptional regulator [Streptomyces albiflaviniger]|nr:PucR family transcriptional regulator [Streptomyces albiflaviniger]